MSHRLVILTGASRGLGAALAEQLLAPGTVMLCLSRGRHPTLAQRASEAQVQIVEWQRDLANSVAVADEVEQWLRAFDASQFDGAILINNAGVIPTVGPSDACTSAELSNALRVGLESTILLTSGFLRATGAWRADRRVLNISSGLGRRAMAGSALYCAVKAGMDHFSRAVALDEAHRADSGRGTAARIASLAPGVIDTDMQAQLRAADSAGFPGQDYFKQQHAGGLLVSAEDTAKRILSYLARQDFGVEPVADIRTA
ncbi:MAG: SDR family NAD(P)-dependent oxidoreductase [Burkholderiaceae bacterium]|nr:SDR family NAD(P)-dependent oxidoreductase [Burkholderiaceae bacterium]